MSHHNLAQRSSALVEFRAQNARSFKDEVTLAMAATAVSERRFIRYVPWREGGKPLLLLPAAGTFGANASGKTNLLKVMSDMRDHVMASFKRSRPGGRIPRRPFLLDKGSKTHPSRYEIELVLEGVLHQYGFELDDDRVIEEWAYWFPKGREALLFRRKDEKVHLGAAHRAKGRAVMEILRPNALFLSAAAAADHPALLPLFGWFDDNLLLMDSDNRPLRKSFTTELLLNEQSREAVLRLLVMADLGIRDVHRVEVDQAERESFQQFLRAVHLVQVGEEPDQEHIASSAPPARAVFRHHGTDGDYEIPEEDESRGTLTWFGLIGPILDALGSGAVLLADELDGSLHPNLVLEILRVFQDRETNIHNAQLVFNSHNVQLLGDASGERLLGRDQIWLTEKLNDGRTRLHPLTDFDPRKKEAIGKRYLDGYYGARPLISVGDSDAAVELVTDSSR